MADSDNEGFDSNDAGVNLTGFLFGNIDESGNLESDVFDSESQKQLGLLGRFVECLLWNTQIYEHISYLFYI